MISNSEVTRLTIGTCTILQYYCVSKLYICTISELCCVECLYTCKACLCVQVVLVYTCRVECRGRMKRSVCFDRSFGCIGAAVFLRAADDKTIPESSTHFYCQTNNKCKEKFPPNHCRKVTNCKTGPLIDSIESDEAPGLLRTLH